MLKLSNKILKGAFETQVEIEIILKYSINCWDYPAVN